MYTYIHVCICVHIYYITFHEYIFICIHTIGWAPRLAILWTRQGLGGGCIIQNRSSKAQIEGPASKALQEAGRRTMETLQPLHPAPCTLHPAPCTLHPAPCTLHPTPFTLHTTPHSLHPTPYTLHPAP